MRLASASMSTLLVYLPNGLPLLAVPFAAAETLQLVQHAINSQYNILGCLGFVVLDRRGILIASFSLDQSLGILVQNFLCQLY